jgi:hypothetical protein
MPGAESLAQDVEGRQETSSSRAGMTGSDLWPSRGSISNRVPLVSNMIGWWLHNVPVIFKE